MLGTQRIPILFLVLIILFQTRWQSSEGPTKKSKIFLFLAAILDFSEGLPLPAWAEILPSTIFLYMYI